MNVQLLRQKKGFLAPLAVCYQCGLAVVTRNIGREAKTTPITGNDLSNFNSG